MASQDKEAQILLAYMHRVRRHGKNASPRGGEWGGASWTLRPQEPHRQGEVFFQWESKGGHRRGGDEVGLHPRLSRTFTGKVGLSGKWGWEAI